MDLKGFDDLLAKLDWMEDNIEDDVGKVVKNNTIELRNKTTRNAVFTRGYQTGYTRRNIEHRMQNNLEGLVTSKSGHSGFLEYGTRYMDAQPFVFPSVKHQQPLYYADLKRLIEG